SSDLLDTLIHRQHFVGDAGGFAVDGGEDFFGSGIAEHVGIVGVDVAGGAEEENAGRAGGGGNLVGHRAGPVGGDDQLVEVHADDRMHRVVDQRDKRPAVVGATQGEHADVVVNWFAGDAVLVVPAHFHRAVGVDDAAIVAGVER